MYTERLKKSINSIVPLSDAEWDKLNVFFDERKLHKNEFVLEAGEVCDSVAYVNSGSLIYYKLSENGTETTTDFAFAGDWLTDNRSRLNKSPSFLNIKAIEETEILVMSNRNLYKCFDEIPKLEKLGRILMENAFIKIAQQSIDFQTLSASERYHKMIHEYPEIFQKVPLYHIANYLGIAAKSLSRIRKG